MSAIKSVCKTYDIPVTEDLKKYTLEFWKSRGFDLKLYDENIYKGERKITQLIRSVWGFPTTLTITFFSDKVEILIEIEWLTSGRTFNLRMFEQEPEFYFYSLSIYKIENEIMSDSDINLFAKQMHKFLNNLFLTTSLSMGFLLIIIFFILLTGENINWGEQLLSMVGIPFVLGVEFVIIQLIKRRDKSKLAFSYLKIRKRKLKSNVDMWLKPKFLKN